MKVGRLRRPSRVFVSAQKDAPIFALQKPQKLAWLIKRAPRSFPVPFFHFKSQNITKTFAKNYRLGVKYMKYGNTQRYRQGM